MVISEVLTALAERGIVARDWHIRHALRAGKIPRPTLDGSHRFVFSKADVDRLAKALSPRHSA